jgi:hypothetical protein
MAYSRRQRVDAIGQQLYGDAWTPAMSNEAWSTISGQMNSVGSTDPSNEDNAYQNLQFNNFLAKFQAEPGSVGQANATAFAKKQTTDAQSTLTDAMKPGSSLYNSVFGEGGIVPSQQATFASSMDTQKQKDTTALNNTLAARGLVTSGSVGAQTSDLDTNYANILSKAFQNMNTQGLENLQNLATGSTVKPDYQGTADTYAQSALNQQAGQKAESAKAASGWSWLTPVATAVGAFAGPIGAGLGALFGGVAQNKLEQPQQSGNTGTSSFASIRNTNPQSFLA